MEDRCNNAVNVVSKTKYVKSIKVISNDNVQTFEKEANDFICSHEVTHLIYKPLYKPEYRDIVYTCCIEYITVVKE